MPVTSKLHLSPHGFGCCPFIGGGFPVVDSLLIVAPSVGFCNFFLSFAVRFFMSILVFQLS